MKLTMIDNLDNIQYDAAKCYVRSRQVGVIFIRLYPGLLIRWFYPFEHRRPGAMLKHIYPELSRP